MRGFPENHEKACGIRFLRIRPDLLHAESGNVRYSARRISASEGYLSRDDEDAELSIRMKKKITRKLI